MFDRNVEIQPIMTGNVALDQFDRYTYLGQLKCWAHPASYYEWIINGPNLLCLVINLGFLVNIIRVLWSKLRARHVNEPSHFSVRTAFDRKEKGESAALMEEVMKCLESLESLWGDFESGLGVTARLWSMYIDMMLILRHYIHAERAGLWQQHLQEVRNMLPYTIASGHSTYMSCLPIYLNEKQKLPETAREVHEEFAAGKFTVHQTAGDFNGVWTDLAMAFIQRFNTLGSRGILACWLLPGSWSERPGNSCDADGTYTDVDELYCPIHEEADTRIFAHIASCDDNNVFVIQATDTDIIFLAMYHFPRLPNVVELWVEKNDLFLSIHDLVNELAKAVGKDVLALTDTLLISYILSGCDSVSYPFKRGKKRTVKVACRMQHVDKHQTLSNCIRHESGPSAHDQVITEARSFFCDVYGKPGYLSLDKLRAPLFASSKLDLPSLPPTEDAFHFHVLRSLCQICLHKQASLSNPVLLPPEEYGRIVDGDRLIPVMKSKPSKPSAAKLKYCKCKKKPNCLRNCPCAKAAVPCIIACACNGDREKCGGRLLTDHCDDDDDDDEEIVLMTLLKTAKATLVLIPLFGVHFLLVLYRPQSDGECVPTKIHFFFYYIVDGIQVLEVNIFDYFQGFLVACIYFYMNSEESQNVRAQLVTSKLVADLCLVQSALKRSYIRFRQSLEDRISSRKMLSSRTQSFSTNVSSLVENHSNHVKSTFIKNGRRDKGELEMTVIQEEKKLLNS
ncbi:hypothetical protein GQR58_004102 [Nymphon striatum]|nr:hypothetical protein GQR58_004102 [Nymphon striatum]